LPNNEEIARENEKQSNSFYFRLSPCEMTRCGAHTLWTLPGGSQMRAPPKKVKESPLNKIHEGLNESPFKIFFKK